MSTRNRGNTVRNLLTPLAVIVSKQRVGQDDANEIALPLLLHFDAAKRGQCTAAGQQHIYKHLIAAQCIATRIRNCAFHAATAKACDALMTASRRPTKLLDLTTPEYKSIRYAISWYLRAMPAMEVGVLSGACEFAEAILNRVPDAA